MIWMGAGEDTESRWTTTTTKTTTTKSTDDGRRIQWDGSEWDGLAWDGTVRGIICIMFSFMSPHTIHFVITSHKRGTTQSEQALCSTYAPDGELLARAAKRCSERVLGCLPAKAAVLELPGLPPPPAGSPGDPAPRGAAPVSRTPRGRGAGIAEQRKSRDIVGAVCLCGKHSFTCSTEGLWSPTSGEATSCKCFLRDADNWVCLAPYPSSRKACFQPLLSSTTFCEAAYTQPNKFFTSSAPPIIASDRLRW